MSTAQYVEVRPSEHAISTAPTWWVVFKRELADLWIGGKAPVLLLIYSILLGILTYVLASNSDLSLVPPKEMVFETLRSALEMGLFIGLILGADSISGERERGTLESLLLTPTSRRQILAGKFLAALTPWPAAIAMSIPFYAVLSQGDDIFLPAVLWGFGVGTLLTIGWTGVGMFVSFWCNNNRTSFAVSLGIFILLYFPTQLPGTVQKEGTAGRFLQWVNPATSSTQFLEKTLTNNRTVEEYWTWLNPPVILAVLALGLVFLYAAPRLRLTAGGTSQRESGWRRVVQRGGSAGLGLLLAAQLASVSASPAMAHGEAQAVAPTSLQVSIDVGAKTLKQSEHVLFNTMVTNTGEEPAPPLILAMNIINLNAEGDVVDPEDWSPERTQYQEELGPGESATHSWRVNAITPGNYLVYMVVLPAPNSPETTSQPITSSAIHLTVTPYTSLNPGGVLPYSIGVPVFAAVLFFLASRLRHRQIDGMGES
jgi:ABC-2 type transport system permease protein